MTTNKRELSDEAREAIAEAVRIVQEDKFYARMMAGAKSSVPTMEPIEPEKVPEPVDDGLPKSPPPKEPEPEPVPPKKAGLYWGEEA